MIFILTDLLHYKMAGRALKDICGKVHTQRSPLSEVTPKLDLIWWSIHTAPVQCALYIVQCVNTYIHRATTTTNNNNNICTSKNIANSHYFAIEPMCQRLALHKHPWDRDGFNNL